VPDGNLADLIDADRVIAELRTLDELTADPKGAQRVCWTPVWKTAREWMRARLGEFADECHQDAAGNSWATLRGADPSRSILIGGHIDSVPNGGWLDGTLNLVAGLEVMRAVALRGAPPVSVRLVDWADEEGARFGRGLVGSSAASGTLDPDELVELRDRDGVRMPDALAEYGVELGSMLDAREELGGATAYFELHIEQGPVLEKLELPLGAVTGTVGVERHVVEFRGEALHAGSTPMDARHDAFAAAARLALEVRRQAVEAEGLATTGRCVTEPGIATATAGRADLWVDQRHPDAAALASMLSRAVESSEAIAAEEGVEAEWSDLWRIEPVDFDPQLIDLASGTIEDLTGAGPRLPSGALHDAAEVAGAGIPAVMLFVRSIGGISHNNAEDSTEADLGLSARALAECVDRSLAS
jgi:hydantoinase/carbamoylase family amidase